jgi:ribonuclease P protein component
MRGHPGAHEAVSLAPAANGMSGTNGAPPRRPVKRAGESLPAAEKLLRRADYLRCYRTGRRRMGALVFLYFIQNQIGHPRIGITATRKVGNAVVRHRLKRRIKEIYRRWPGRGGLAPLDLVVHLKPEARGSGFDDLAADVRGLLAGVGPRRQRSERQESQG